MLPLALLLIGSLLVMAALLAGRGRAGKTGRRRMEAVRARHLPANIVETQMRRIAAQRASKLEEGFHRLVPNPELLRKRIEMAGKSWTLAQYGIGCMVVAGVVFFLLFIRGAPFLLSLLLGIAAGIGLPHWHVGRMGMKRIRKFLAEFPDAIDLLVRGLRSGLPISETMGVVGSEIPDPVGGEFRAVADRMRIGRTMEAALQETADRLATPEFQFFVITLAIQRETGGNLAETLSNLGDVLRKRLQMKLKIRAMSSESKASAYIIGALPFLVFGIIWYMNPEYMGKFFSDTRLMIAACGGGVWMGIGVFIMAKMINFEV